MRVGYAATYDPDTDFDRVYTDATAAAVGRFLEPGARVLELGCATGRMTAALAARGARIVAVDREAVYLERLAARHLPDVEPLLADLDADALPDGPFDHVVLANVLHEVAAPHTVLRAARGTLTPDGRIHVTLQNPASLHRIVAREMGLLDDLEAVSDRGAAFGTTRLWSATALEALLRDAGIDVVHRDGLVLKPLPNALLAQLPPDVLAGLAAAGRHVPRHAAMTYLVGVARPPAPGDRR